MTCDMDQRMAHTRISVHTLRVFATQPLALGRVLGTVARLVLHGPQGGDLGLGQSSDAGDIEALVGPVAAQGVQMLATLQVPDLDGPIIAATGQPAAIGTDLERLHGPLMGFSHPDALPVLQIPPAQPAVTASTDEPIPHWIPGNCRDYLHKSLQGVEALLTVRLPDEDLSTASAPTTTGQPRAI